MTKKSKREFRPITALKRSVVFDGRGSLKCERCGTTETLVPPVYPEMPRDRYAWETRLNEKIEAFLNRHRECA